MNCNCRENSRFDPEGNLVILYSCKSCLEYALKKIRESVCNSPSGVVQLELFEGYGAEGSNFGYHPTDAEIGQYP